MSEDTPKEIGFRPSKDEFELVTSVLASNAEEARKRGHTAIYAALKRFCVRLKQHVVDVDGPDPKLLESMSQRIEAAFASGDYEGARQALVHLLSAVGRCHHDPANEVALMLAPMLVQLVARSAQQQQLTIGADALKKFVKKLREDRKAFEKEGWGTPESVFEYTCDLAEYCAAELDCGLDAFEELAKGNVETQTVDDVDHE